MAECFVGEYNMLHVWSECDTNLILRTDFFPTVNIPWLHWSLWESLIPYDIMSSRTSRHFDSQMEWSIAHFSTVGSHELNLCTASVCTLATATLYIHPFINKWSQWVKSNNIQNDISVIMWRSKIPCSYNSISQDETRTEMCMYIRKKKQWICVLELWFGDFYLDFYLALSCFKLFTKTIIIDLIIVYQSMNSL